MGADLKSLHEEILADPPESVPQKLVDVGQVHVCAVHDGSQVSHRVSQSMHCPEILWLLLYLRVHEERADVRIAVHPNCQ